MGEGYLSPHSTEDLGSMPLSNRSSKQRPPLAPRVSESRWLLSLFLALVAAQGGCQRSGSSRPLSGDKLPLEIKGVRLVAEVACDPIARSAGLMYRRSLPESQGMLFVHPQPDKLEFWMRDTVIPLSIAFLDDSGKILQIEDMRPKDESKTMSKYRVRYALEVNQGWFQHNGVGVGDTFTDFVAKVRPYHGS